MSRSSSSSFSRGVLVAGLASLLGACAIVPGDRAYSMREESAVKLPVRQEGAAEAVPDNVKIKPINAELIIEQFKNAQPARALLSASAAADAAKKTQNSNTPALDYKVGTVTSSPSSCGITPNSPPRPANTVQPIRPVP